MLRVRYDEPCIPPLPPTTRSGPPREWSAYRQAHPELFPDANGR